MKKVFAALAILLGATAGFMAGRTPRVPMMTTPPDPQIDASGPEIARPQPGTPALHFNWSQVESEEVQQYIANLRAIGCPEQTITDIIRARLFSVYQAKVNAVFNPLARYWCTTAEAKAVDAQVKAIRDERDKVLDGLKLENSTFDTSSVLPPDKQRHIADALKLYPKNLPGPDASPQDWAPALAARKARISYLSQFLTPDELLDYRIAQDGNAFGIGLLLRDLNVSDAEFRNVFSALDGEDLTSTNGFLSPSLDARLKEALGEARYAEYLSQTAPENHTFNRFVGSANLSADQIQQLRNLRAAADTLDMQQYRQAAANIFQNNSSALHRYFADPLLFRGKPQ